MSQSVLSFLSSLSLVVRDASGEVDLEATAEKVKFDLSMEVEATRELDVQIERELDTLFNEVGAGKGVPTPFAVSRVATRIGGDDLDSVMALQVSVEDYLKRSPRFESRRGRNGGLFRKG